MHHPTKQLRQYIDHVFSQLYGYLSVVGTSVLLAHSIEAVAAENKHLLCSPVDFQCFYQHRSQQGSIEPVHGISFPQK